MASAAELEFATVARLIGDRTRSTFLDALMDTPPRSLSELARAAGVTPATASVHLAKLVDGRLVTATKRGRRRYFALAGMSPRRSSRCRCSVQCRIGGYGEHSDREASE
jgi:DNA-binding transcriptional ArsR family regulator